MELNKINKDQIKKEESQLSRSMSKNVSTRFMSQRTKYVFDDNQDSYEI